MMAFAVQADVEARLRRVLTTEESTYIYPQIAEAQALVIGYVGTDFSTLDAIPGAVTIVTSRMVARVLEAGAGGSTQQQSAGPFSTSFVSGSTSGNPWLAAADKITLKPYRVMGGAVSVALRSDREVLPYTGSITI